MNKDRKKPGAVKLLFSLVLGFGLAFITWSLGNWQTGRAEQKAALHDKQAKALLAAPISPSDSTLEVDNLSYRKVELHGRYLSNAVVYIDNRQVNGRPAVQVVQAFQPDGKGFVVPVDRGLLLRNPAEPRRAPEMPTEVLPQADASGAESTGRVLIQGTLLPRFAQSAELRGMQLDDAHAIHREQSNGFEVWSNFSAAEFGRLVGQPVSNFVVTLQPVGLAGDVAPAAKKVDGFYHAPVALPEQVAKHQGYAFQWYSMTLALIVLTLFFVYREFFHERSK